ncbi:Translation initiation factor IF-2 [bacterium HR37]|nr:Translation initiation factor IF-2 [bacterium HR37]
MANIRVYELSKELGISNKEVIDIAKRIGISIRSHTSSISDEEANRIKERVKSKGSPQTLDGEEKKVKEEVRVFRSETGEEVVERRRGRNVIIRKKRRQEQEEAETETVEEAKTEGEKAEETVDEERQISAREETVESPPVGEEVEPEGQIEHEEAEYRELKTLGESVAEEAPSEKPVDVVDEEKSVEPEKTVSVSSKEDQEEKLQESFSIEEAKPKKDKPSVLVETKEEAEEEEEGRRKEEGKKVRKKGQKVKPKREEIIDEETLEELRRAFRTKLPGRRREYLVEDRRSQRSKTEVPSQQRRGEDVKRHFTARKEGRVASQQQVADESAQVIPFPVKPSKRTIKIGESITVGELAKRMGVKASEVIKKLMSLGVMATVNQSIDHETATIVASEFGFDVTVDVFEERELLEEQEQDTPDKLVPRPPVVTVMGHVDHGKTTLLDAIRHTNVVEKEAGGITQHIGAYSVDVDGRKVVFIDTPGHEAFTAMRARGAQVTDVVVLVVAADDGVMPQTIEAINHARAAGVPIVVAINKVDKPEANPDKVKRQLSEIGLIPEEWGGDTLFAEVSAKRKTGIKELLELILLQADILELKANPYKRAKGVVIEAKLDKGRGPVATVIVKEGTLRVGDYVVAGTTYGRVRALIDDRGNRVEEVGPSMPAEIMGLSGVPTAGEQFYVVKDEKTAKEIASYRETKERQKIAARERKLSLEDLFKSLEKGEIKELPLIIKADVQGSVEALKEAITKLSTDKCRVKIVHAGVGAVNETDIALASASNAVVVGFNVRPDPKALEAAEREQVSLELHTIIYDVVDRIKKAMEGLLEPVIKEKVVGHAEVKATFHISKVGTIAGCLVTDGKVVRGYNVRVIRDGVVVFDGKCASLKRFKEDVKEVQSGYECGIGIQDFNDIKVGDRLEFYTFEEVKQEL